jgi:hypothetical protein
VVQHALARGVFCQQRFDFTPQIRIGFANIGEKSLAIRGRTFDRGVIEFFDPPPAFGSDDPWGLRLADYTPIIRS